MTPKIISIHTPKAGGTSTLELWKQAFGVDRVLMDYDDPPANPCASFIIDPVGWAAQRPKALPDTVQVVHGHFRPGKYDLIKNTFRLTMLRHPVDNLISIYCYWKKIPPQPNAVHQYFLNNNLDVLGLARLPIIQNLYSETYFGGWDINKLDFVGRHENRESDLKVLAEMLSINIDVKLHLNMTSPFCVDAEKEAIVSNVDLMNELSHLLCRDIDLYNNITNR